MEPNPQDTMKYPTDEHDDSSEAASSPRRAMPRFVHPGGSRPLDGYTIKRGVGHGGFGEIYYAVSDAGKEVALKLIRRNLDIELRGIRHCLNLKHPNLLNLFDIRQDDDGDTWVVMEYVAGGCLADIAAKYPDGMPTKEALEWFFGIAAGVAYLHGQGIVHRDLKPANIFWDQGIVKVGDYGLSKFISCSQRSGQTESVGTVHYMAPEVANGRYGKEIDVYALGIVLFELLTGHVPFEGESVGEVLMKHLTATADVSALAEPYRGVVARALEKDPEKRYRTVDQLLAALGRTTPAAGETAGVYAQPAVAEAQPADDPPPPEPAIEAEAIEEEPIQRAVEVACSKLKHGWQEADLPGPAKVVILVVGIILLLVGGLTLWPLLFTLLVVYGVYRVVWMLITPSHSQPRYQPPHPVPPPPAGATQRYGAAYARVRDHQRQRRADLETAAERLQRKPLAERLTELVGSMLIGALVAIAMSVVMMVVNGYFLEGRMPPGGFGQLSQYAWLVLVSIAGTWAILIPAKFWEGTNGEALLRRFIMLVMGLAVGGVAFATADLLLVNLPRNPDLEFRFIQIQNLRDPNTGLLAVAHLACFGTLFLVLRWWRQANPLRYTRLSLWSLLWITVIAALVAASWNYPASWMMMVAGAISVSVQLASPWIPPADRVPQPIAAEGRE